MLTDEFLDKFDKQILTFEECKELSHFLHFQNTKNSTFEDVENCNSYQIFKIINFKTKIERYFLQLQKEVEEYRILELKYKGASMQLKKEFLELSSNFNNINEDKLLFIGMFLNFYMSKSNFKNKSEVQEHLKLYFNTEKDPIKIVKEVINNENTDMNYLLNRLYLALVHKKENKTIDKNTWEHFLENL